MADWKREIERERAAKDEYLRDHPQSPLPPAERDTFDGLDYYPIREAYRFVRPLHEFDDHEELTVETTQEGERTYLRWGEFGFELGGEERALVAYKSEADEDRFWVPFRDETNGDTTYPAGRYLDLTPEERTGDGEWVLDFNRAYSPFCAFSEAYECPLVPPENHLDVRVEAGEKYEA